MAAIFAFKCSCCGEIHEGSPSFSFRAPAYYDQLDAVQQREIATLDADTCTIRDGEHVDFFVRACLEVPIHGIESPFLWGVWVSLSEASFKRYLDTWDAPDLNDSYFGWFSNQLPFYPDTINLKTQAHPRAGGNRPTLELEPTGHPLAIDFATGISVERAQEIAEAVMHAR